MAVSTLFTSPKVAQYVGGLLLIVPVLLMLHFIQMGEDDHGKNFVYLFFFLPIMPACALFCQLST